MKIRRNIPVKVHVKYDCNGKNLLITVSNGEYNLSAIDGSVTIASCESAKRLNDWAFEGGAFSVRHQYDCRLSDNEL